MVFPLVLGMPMSHILYCLVPTFPIQYIVEKRDVLLHFLQDRVKDPRLSRNILLIILVILGIEVMVSLKYSSFVFLLEKCFIKIFHNVFHFSNMCRGFDKYGS